MNSVPVIDTLPERGEVREDLLGTIVKHTCCSQRFFHVSPRLTEMYDKHSDFNVVSAFLHLGLLEIYMKGKVHLCDAKTGEVVSDTLSPVEIPAQKALPDYDFASKKASKKRFGFVVWDGTNVIRRCMKHCPRLVPCNARGNYVLFDKSIFRYNGRDEPMTKVCDYQKYPDLSLVDENGQVYT